MSKQISEYLILKAGKDFIFKVPHLGFQKTNAMNTQESSLFNELCLLNFNPISEVVIFKTVDHRIGTIGDEFTSWYPAEKRSLSMILTNEAVNEIHLLNMKPAKGPGFCTFSFPPDSREFVFFFLAGSDSNWDNNFKKTGKLLSEISGFLGCHEVKIHTAYNC